MELAGLACAQALARVYDKERYPRVLVCCGPGNQGMNGERGSHKHLAHLNSIFLTGGDGLVAAQHLGPYNPSSIFPILERAYRHVRVSANHLHAQGMTPPTKSASFNTNPLFSLATKTTTK